MLKKLNEIIIQTQIAVKAMPLLLKFFTLSGIMGFLFVVVPLMPFGTYKISGEEVTFKEFWLTGAAPCMIVTGILLFLAGIGFITKDKKARIYFILAWVSSYLYPAFVMESSNYNLINLSFFLFFLLFFIWYLFGSKAVRQYFS